MKPQDQFWEALAFLLRPDDPAHNAAMMRDFAKISEISEETIRDRLAQTLLSGGGRQ
jgi:hypothetical protein